jgi:hypothetical protein
MFMVVMSLGSDVPCPASSVKEMARRRKSIF